MTKTKTRSKKSSIEETLEGFSCAGAVMGGEDSVVGVSLGCAAYAARGVEGSILQIAFACSSLMECAKKMLAAVSDSIDDC